MAQISSEFRIYEADKKSLVAKIVLNGYDIEAGEQHGEIRSFKVVQGDLWPQWNTRTPLIMHINENLALTIRVAALPVDEDSFGLLEFL